MNIPSETARELALLEHIEIDPDVTQASLATQLGVSGQSPSWLSSPLAGYEIQALSSAWLRRAAAGLAGLALIYGLCLATGRLLARRSA